MNKALLVILGLIVVAGVGAYVYTQLGGNGRLEKKMETKQERSLRELMASGEDTRCTFESSDPNSINKGTVYIAGGKMRGDFTTTLTASGNVIESHSVMVDGYANMWSDASEQGMRVKLVDGLPQTSTASEGQQTFDYNAAYAYQCEPWTPDESQFKVPAGMIFMELSMPPSMMQGQGTVQTGSSGKAQMCGQCEIIPDQAAKTQCKRAYSC